MANLISIPAEIAVGVGVGQAIGDIVEPKLRTFRFDQSEKYPHIPLAADLAALAAVKQIDSTLDFANEAKRNGYDADRFDVMRKVAMTWPELSLAFEWFRRNPGSRDQVVAWLRRNGFTDETITHLIGGGPDPGSLTQARLTPAQIALGIVRSIVRDPGFLPVTLKTSGGKVPSYQQSDIGPLIEAEDWGIDKERLRVMVGEIGLPMSLQQAASATFRQIIERPDFNRAVLEGDTRPEWADAIFEQARQILTANQYAELELRGFLARDARRTKTAQHGMSDGDSDLLFDLLGRSIPVHQIVTGEARGGTYKPPPATLGEQEAGIPADFLASLKRGNLRPEFYNLAYANRYSYPSAFVLRALAEAGDLTQAETHQILLNIGWPPALADKVSKRWTAQAAGGASSYVGKALTQLWTTTHSAFVAREASQGDVTTTLDYLGVPAADQATIIEAWSLERDLTRKALSDANVRKAYKKGLLTGDECVARLEAMGYSFEDAQLFLQL